MPNTDELSVTNKNTCCPTKRPHDQAKLYDQARPKKYKSSMNYKLILKYKFSMNYKYILKYKFSMTYKLIVNYKLSMNYK